ncbi:MAG TPA: hypothetical protein VFJ75_04260 [Gaiellaceae bacterium]|nr:hypothetical protein [Gaiellaceae bacterium]
MEGWESWQRRMPDGAIDSEQRVALQRPVVERSLAGAEQLGRAYWRAVRRATASLVRARQQDGAVELRLLGRAPVLLRFGPPSLEASNAHVTCSYPIVGGFLTGRAGGELAFEQTAASLRSTIRGFSPRIAFYGRLQGRAHVAISRRYFQELVAEARE